MKRSGFTLVELSIVLVILGLLVGGVLSGQALIHAAELRSVGTERDKTITAINAFRDKYFALPGDMANAYSFWGTACGTNAIAPSTGCNGNGNGFIEPFDMNDSSGLGENKKAWEHLSRAGLIEGNFDGTGALEGNGWVAHSTTNTMKARYSDAYWSLTFDPADIANMGTASLGLYLELGTFPTDDSYGGELNTIAGFTNGDAWNVDKKLDDGQANTGMVRGDNRSDCEDDGTDYYDLQMVGADNTGACMLHFILK